jgi:DnaK suppressor protein
MKRRAAERARKALLERWTSLVANRASLAEAVQQLSGLRAQDASEAAIARIDAAVLGELDDRELQELLDIADAVVRLESGDFGRCTVCGEEIEPLRLEAMPWTPACFACAKSKARGDSPAPRPVRALAPRVEELPEEPRILGERELDVLVTARPGIQQLRADATADASEEPLDIGRRVLEETTEAPSGSSEVVTEYPRDLIYVPDELLDDHLKFGETGELDDVFDSSPLDSRMEH